MTTKTSVAAVRKAMESDLPKLPAESETAYRARLANSYLFVEPIDLTNLPPAVFTRDAFEAAPSCSAIGFIHVDCD